MPHHLLRAQAVIWLFPHVSPKQKRNLWVLVSIFGCSHGLRLRLAEFDYLIMSHWCDKGSLEWTDSIINLWHVHVIENGTEKQVNKSPTCELIWTNQVMISGTRRYFWRFKRHKSSVIYLHYVQEKANISKWHHRGLSWSSNLSVLSLQV